MSNGWIKLHRDFLHDQLWLSEKFTRGQAWVDLLALANHEQGHIISNGMKIELKRGQLGWSEVRLSERWRWSRNKVRRFLSMLEEEGFLEQQKSKRSSITTILNYEALQGVGTINDGVVEHQKHNSRNTNKKNKNEKKEELKDICPQTLRVEDEIVEHIQQFELIEEKTEQPSNQPVLEVFEYWKQRMGLSDRTRLTTERKKAIQTRIKGGYSAEELKRAVDGCASSEFHMGKNTQGTLYNDLTLILRNDTKVDMFIQKFFDVESGAMDSRKMTHEGTDYVRDSEARRRDVAATIKQIEQELWEDQQAGRTYTLADIFSNRA